MQLRSNILPRTIPDALGTAFTFIIIPTLYYFELFVVLPKFFVPWQGWYLCHFIAGTFICFNISANWLAIIVCDTSIRGRYVRPEPQSRFCAVCESIAPPRSWHCDVCDTCILKRDHHCMFTGCCIGHHNQRYFAVFIGYVFVATLYTTFYNIYFIFEFAEFGSVMTIVKLVFPLASLFVDFTRNQLYVFLVFISLISCFVSGTLAVFLADLILRGAVTHERGDPRDKYDLGRRMNLIGVFGVKWHLIWIAPSIDSALPLDGIVWTTKQSLKEN